MIEILAKFNFFISSEISKCFELGRLVFTDVMFRYRQGTPLALTGLSFTIESCERVGLVGRTGAGKSTVLYALLRFVEMEGGHITIDGTDVSKIGLKLLRDKLAVIPQHPVLLQGTVRYNLDPFELHTDEQLQIALKKASLHRLNLSDEIRESGEGLSVGERQLLSFARCLVEEKKVKTKKFFWPKLV